MPIWGGRKGRKGEREGEGERGEFPNVNTYAQGTLSYDASHYFYKKEYQAWGAPHYHMILWIDGDPTVGDDEREVVLWWIQERITLHTRGNQQPRAASAGR